MKKGIIYVSTGKRIIVFINYLSFKIILNNIGNISFEPHITQILSSIDIARCFAAKIQSVLMLFAVLVYN